MSYSLLSKTLLLAAMTFGLTMVSCGKDHNSQLNALSQDSCLTAAASKRDGAYLSAQKAYDQSMAVCYKLLDDEQYTVFARCTKVAEEAQSKAKADADRILRRDQQSCGNE